MTEQFESSFLKSDRRHILMITNHGIHDFEIRSGLIDTGGQNHYVNALADTFVSLGFKVTTFNRGGFPDPVSGKPRSGAIYKNESNRIVYLEGGGGAFIRKEDLTREILTSEAEFALNLIEKEGLRTELIVSHYWDGALLGCILKKKLALNAKHVFIPHSLGALKKENFKGKPAEVVAPLKFDDRIAYEKEVIKEVDAVGSTSGDITHFLKDIYGRAPELYLPPCVNTDKVYPVDPNKCEKIYDFLKSADPLSGGDVKGCPTLLEVSRTDHTKRKDVVIKAFHSILKKHKNSKLLLTISPDNKTVYNELTTLIDELGIRHQVVMIGTVPRDIIPELYSVATVYCSPSEMEGFGMSVQEACACKRAIVSSHLVPFAVEYLLENVKDETIQTSVGKCTIRWGAGGAIVPAGDVDGFAHAIERLMSDEKLREKIAQRSYEITIPYFTWPGMTKRMLADLGLVNT